MQQSTNAPEAAHVSSLCKKK